MFIFGRWFQLCEEADDGTGTGGGGPGGGDPESKGDDKGEDDPAGKEAEPDALGDDDGKLDVFSLPPKAQKMIENLRKEAASNRTKNKASSARFEKLQKALVDAGIVESDEQDPEEKIRGLSDSNAELATKAGLLEAAIEYGIPKDKVKYFNFLIVEELDGLSEDEDEISEDRMLQIALEAKQSGKGAPRDSSVNDKSGKGNDGAPPPGDEKGAVTLEQFGKMSMAEKVALNEKSPEVYDRLFAEAKKKRLLR